MPAHYLSSHPLPSPSPSPLNARPAIITCQRWGSNSSNADIYFLADTTSSMADVLGAVQGEAHNIIAELQATITNVAFGAGEYRDLAEADAYPAFRNTAPVAADRGATALEAIQGWVAGAGGSDVAEDQLYALYQVCSRLRRSSGVCRMA